MASPRPSRPGPPVPHRSTVGPRPRYARILAAGGSVVVIVVALLGATGVVPVHDGVALAAADTSSGSASASNNSSGASSGTGAGGASSASGADGTSSRPRASTSGSRSSTASGAASSTGQHSTGTRQAGGGQQSTGSSGAESSQQADQQSTSTDGGTGAAPGVPAHSGTGRRVVFDQADQRVWLVAHRHGHDVVQRTYLVSGSVTDNLDPGTYAVYSRSMHAIGISDSGTMRYMVRFAHGQHAAIGFHDIPVKDGAKVQGTDQLGAPQSHGCIRQWRPDAKALWRFAPLNTPVVVV